MDTLGSTSSVPSAGGGDFITVVSGVPRSGTSMMMQLLGAGGMALLTDGIRGADADNPRGYFEFEPVKLIPADTSWLAEAYGKAVKIIYALLTHLPAQHRYRVIFMWRNLDEIMASQEVMLRHRDAGAMRSDQVVRTLREQLSEIDAWLRQQANFDVLPLDYADVLASPRSAAARIDEFLGGGLDREAMARVPDPALHRQRA